MDVGRLSCCLVCSALFALCLASCASGRGVIGLKYDSQVGYQESGSNIGSPGDGENGFIVIPPNPNTDAAITNNNTDTSPSVILDQGVQQTDSSSTTVPACVNSTYGRSYASNMVVCHSSTSFNQCEAEQRCNQAAGWHMCTASEFLARGGKDANNAPGSGNSAWLKARIRNGPSDQPGTPEDQICSKCVKEYSSASYKVIWSCDQSTSYNATALYIGIGSDYRCFRIGENNTTWAGYWALGVPTEMLNHVLCCN